MQRIVTNVWIRSMPTLSILTPLTFILNVAIFSQQDTTAADSSLLKLTEGQIKPDRQVLPEKSAGRTTPTTNPNIGVIGDFQGSYHSATERNFDAFLNEAEFSFQSVVDPYVRADFFLSLAKDQSTGKFAADLEEAYLTTLELPARLQLKAGKFRSSLGRLNMVHPHALPFVDLPISIVNYFGDDGLNDEGLSLSWLVPNPFDFYQEIVFEATNGPVGIPSFIQSTFNRFLYLAHVKNFWDLTENATLELGFTGMAGPNDSLRSTTIGAIDVTYKWKPLRFSTYQSFVWQSEAFFCKAKSGENTLVNSWGMYSFATHQLEKRWFLTGRFDYANGPFTGDMVERAYSATLGWYATEFQKIELQGKTTTSNFDKQFYEIMIRWIFAIGAHGAHQY